MPVTIYDDGSLYGDADAIYGRIGTALANAQLARVRETGLRVRVLDEQLNQWELHAGAHSHPDEGLGRAVYDPVYGDLPGWDIGYSGFHGRCDYAVKNNGDIYRVRQGDPADANDNQLWHQTITDPGNPSQWTSWSVLYSGTHYGSATVEIDPADGTTPIVYHCKSDGLYRNNSKVIDNSALETSTEKCIWYFPIKGAPDSGWLQTVMPPTTGGSRRMFNFYAVLDVVTPDFYLEPTISYGWSQASLAGIMSEDETKYHFLMNAPFHFNTRNGNNGMEVAYFRVDSDTWNQTPFYPIRGIGGGAGINYITGPRISLLSDGFYYYTAFEWHRPAGGQYSDATSLGYGFPIWSRSKDLMHWSEPVVGPPMKNAWGFIGGFVESEGYVYMADSEEVWRRPIGTITTDLSNYVPELNFEIPRDNQPASGTVKVANPDGVHNELLTMSDREIVIEPGIKVADGSYEFVQFDRFFIDQVNKEVAGAANRLEIGIGNIWDRLDNPMRDVTNFVGKFTWDDFSEGKRNEPFNYFFATSTNPTVDEFFRLNTGGIVLLTAWKGHNPDITVRFSGASGNPRVICRYIDANNYAYFEYNTGSGAWSWNYLIDGDVNLQASGSTSADSTPVIRVRLRYGFFTLWVNGNLVENNYLPLTWTLAPGYVGFSSSSGSYKINDLHVEDWEWDLQTSDLVKTALAMGDFHDFNVGGADSRAVAIVWGPQTDIDTPAAALASMLETEKLQLCWRNGRVEVGRFEDQNPVRTIEDTVIESDEIDEASRRVNIVSVDGNEHYWLEVDVTDSKERGRMVAAYYDLPELLDQDAVTNRAREEMKRAAQGRSPGGTTPLYFDLWRMDAVTWIDNQGNSNVVRIEGFSVEINQSTTPYQRQTFDTSLYTQGSSDGLMEEGIPE